MYVCERVGVEDTRLGPCPYGNNLAYLSFFSIPPPLHERGLEHVSNPVPLPMDSWYPPKGTSNRSESGYNAWSHGLPILVLETYSFVGTYMYLCR